ncbi:MAG: hypothetical protein IPG64_17000 [Haliea sp.]|nr:hypothetical protein [Haliea sp.]
MLVTLPAGAVAGDVITVSIDGSTPITTVTAAEAAAPATPISVLLPAADITAAGQGPATITTTYADAAGNAAAPVTTAVDIDTVAPAPTVNVPEAAGGINATEAADGVPVLVTLPAGAVAGDVITVSIDGSTPHHPHRDRGRSGRPGHTDLRAAARRRHHGGRSRSCHHHHHLRRCRWQCRGAGDDRRRHRHGSPQQHRQ